MNKNIESLSERLADKEIEGKYLAEQLDNQLKQLKKVITLESIMKN